jgi:hypothetical protein
MYKIFCTVKFVWINIIGSGPMNIRIMALNVSCLQIFPNFWSFLNVGNNFTEFLIHKYFHIKGKPMTESPRWKVQK